MTISRFEIIKENLLTISITENASGTAEQNKL